MKHKEKALKAPDLKVKKKKMKQSKKAESEVPEGVAAAPLADALAMNGTTDPVTKKQKKRKALKSLEQRPITEAVPVTKQKKKAKKKVAESPEEAAAASLEPNGDLAAKPSKKRRLKQAEGSADHTADPTAREQPPVVVADLPKPVTSAAEAPPTLSKKEKKRKKRLQPTETAPAAEADVGQQQADTNLDPVPDMIEGEAAEEAAPAAGKASSAAKAFQRVRAEEWAGKQGAWDNSYKATFGDSGWGAKAQAVLGQVRGKDFRHEKTKKKRGSYRGGVIDNVVNSIKFESDDE